MEGSDVVSLDMSGKVALITGGSKGIGKAIAREFVEAGARVMISSRKLEVLEQAAEEIGLGVEVFAANAGEPEQAAAGVRACIDRLGRLDVLVNNAATNPYYGPTIDIDLPRHDKTWQVNFRGPLTWTQEAWRAWMQDHGGTVVNISSIDGCGVDATGMRGIYGASKAALVHLTQQLALELAPGVRVNAIAPGVIRTDMARALWEAEDGAKSREIPLQRFGEPADIAGLALFLASDAGQWVTGQNFVMDGGATSTGNAVFEPRAGSD